MPVTSLQNSSVAVKHYFSYLQVNRTFLKPVKNTSIRAIVAWGNPLLRMIAVFNIFHGHGHILVF